MVYIPTDTQTRARFVIASEARQSRVACARAGLPRRPISNQAPRNDGYIPFLAASRLRVKQSFFRAKTQRRKESLQERLYD